MNDAPPDELPPVPDATEAVAADPLGDALAGKFGHGTAAGPLAAATQPVDPAPVTDGHRAFGKVVRRVLQTLDGIGDRFERALRKRAALPVEDVPANAFTGDELDEAEELVAIIAAKRAWSVESAPEVCLVILLARPLVARGMGIAEAAKAKPKELPAPGAATPPPVKEVEAVATPEGYRPLTPRTVVQS